MGRANKMIQYVANASIVLAGIYFVSEQSQKAAWALSVTILLGILVNQPQVLEQFARLIDNINSTKKVQ